jgi:hypothetical protein
VVDTKIVLRYLTGSGKWSADNASRADAMWKSDGLEILWFGDLDHGQAFQKKGTRRKLVQIVRDFCKEKQVKNVEHC